MKTDEIVVGEQYAVTTYGNATSRYTNFDRARVEEVRVERVVRGAAYYQTSQKATDGVRVTLLEEKTGRKMRGLTDGPERVLRPAQIGHLWTAEVERREAKAEREKEAKAERATLDARMKSIVDDLAELGIKDVDWMPHRFAGVYLDLADTAALQLEAVLREIVGGSEGVDHDVLAQAAAKAVPEDEWEES